MSTERSRGCTDIPAEEDKFEIQKYINGLTKFIEDCDTPMTIAIQGDWGTGKTSVMKMVRKGLEGKFSNIIWCKTWQFSQFDMGEKLPVLLLSKLMSNLGLSRSEMLKGKALGAMKGILSVVVGYASQGATDGSELVDTLFSGNAADSFEKLAEAFSELVKEKTENDKDRVIIFVDDLDRLPPGRAVELLEVMKNFFDCERCVFVLAVDYGVVIRGVKEKYGQDFDTEKGKSFFDKIIQVPFRMPVSRYNIKSYVQDNLKRIGIMIKDNEELQHYVDLIEKSVGSNPRSMKRLFNSFLLLEGVADKEITEETNNRLILFALLCMQSKFDKIYDYLVSKRERIDINFLEALSDVNSDEIKEMGLNEDEKADFCSFATLLKNLIDQDRNKNLSEDEVKKFSKVLDFSSITSKDISEKISVKRGSRVVTDISEFKMDMKSQEQIKDIITYLENNFPKVVFEKVLNNDGTGHILGRAIKGGQKFIDVYGKGYGVSYDLYVPNADYYDRKNKNIPDIFSKVMDHFDVSPMPKFYSGRCISVPVRDEDTEGKKLAADMVKACYELQLKG